MRKRQDEEKWGYVYLIDFYPTFFDFWREITNSEED